MAALLYTWWVFNNFDFGILENEGNFRQSYPSLFKTSVAPLFLCTALFFYSSWADVFDRSIRKTNSTCFNT